MNLLLESGPWGNLGDVSMLEAVALQLREILPDATIHVLAPKSVRSDICAALNHIPPMTIVPLGDDFLSKFSFFQSHKSFRERSTWTLTMSGLGRAIRPGELAVRFETRDRIPRTPLSKFCEKFDGLHIVGGGNLTDTFLPELFRKCCLIHTFAEQRKPVLLSGQQLGPFKSALLRKSLERTLRLVRFVGLRDPGESVRICENARLSSGSFAVMGDDSLGLPPADERTVRKVLDKHRLREKEFLAINVRFTDYGLTDPNSFEWFASLCNRLSATVAMPIMVVPVHLSGAESDIASGRKIAKLSSAPVSVLDQEDLTAPLVKGLLSRSFGAVGVSHHFCTFALSTGVPAICIYQGDYYRQKAQALVAIWRDKRISLSLDRFHPDAAAEHIVTVLRDRTLRSHLVSISKIATQEWLDLLSKNVVAAYPLESRKMPSKTAAEIFDTSVR